MRILLAVLITACAWHSTAFGQCAPAPDSPYFFRDLSEKRAEARIAELVAKGETTRRHFFAISNYQLIEHRKGYTVASYLLREGTTDDGETRIAELQVREVYEVQDGKWRLAFVESTPLNGTGPATQALR